MGKTYILSTIKEIVNELSADQIDNFIIDFKSFLEYAIAVKIMAKDNKLDLQKFTWIDDGKYEKTINLIEKTTGEKVSIKIT